MDVNVVLGIFFTHRAIVLILLRVIQLVNVVLVSGDIRYITYDITHLLIPFGFHSAQCDSVTVVKILYYGANT